MKRSKLLLGISVWLLTGCGSYVKIGDLTMVSTRNVDSHTDYVELRRYVKAIGKTKGDEKALEAAIDNAVKQVPGGEYLKNCSIYIKDEVIKVEGDVWGLAGKETQMDDKSYEKVQRKKQKEAFKKEKKALKDNE